MTVVAQDPPSTPVDAQPPASTPFVEDDRVSKSFQFYPAEGKLGDFFDLSIEAGTTFSTTVLIANTGEVTNDLRTYAIDAFTADGGGFAASEYGTPPNEVTSWLDYPEEVFAIGVDEGIERTFTVTVPEGTAPGQYITAIAAANAESGEIEGTGNLSQVTRYVIPVFITVPGETKTGFEIGEMTMYSNDDATVIDVGIQNTGDIRVRPEGAVEIVDGAGELVLSLPVQMESIYARESTVLTLGSAGVLPSGTYRIRVDFTDPDTGETATAESDDIAFSSDAAAISTTFTIASASVTPAPSVDDVQFATVEAVIANGGDPIANAQLSLVASVNGEEVERFPISQSLSLPTGDTPVTTRYIPLTGWTPGEWTFELLLETVEPSGAAVVVGSQTIEGTITIP